MSTFAQEEVIKAAEYLDSHVGKFDWLTSDWREKINPDALNMSSTIWCILGQLEGSYETADELLDEEDSTSWSAVSNAFASYTQEWKEYIKESRDDGKPKVGQVWYHKTSTTALHRKIEAVIDRPDGIYVVTTFGELDAPYTWVLGNLMEYYQPMKPNRFQKGDILASSDRKVKFIYISDDKLIRIGSIADALDPMGYDALAYYEETFGPLVKTGETFAQEFKDLL